MSTWIWIVLIVLAGLLLLAVGGTLFFFDYAVRRKPMKKKELPAPLDLWAKLRPLMQEGRDWITAQPLMKAEITSFDGLRLRASLLEANSPTRRVVLMMHGFRAQNFSDFTNSVRYFHQAGYHVILADQRAHGESEGKYITYGINERYDCQRWAEFAIDRYGADCQLFLMGVSMGASTVLMSLGLPLPPNVLGVIADCGFTSPAAIFRHVIWHSYHLPAFPFVHGAELLCRLRAGFSPCAYSTEEALANNKIPVLFLHGEADTFVPPWMSQHNFAACTAEKELLLIPSAKHAMCFLLAPETCWQHCQAFMEKQLQNFFETP